MSKSNNVSTAQGAETQTEKTISDIKNEIVTVETVKRFLKTDLLTATMAINAIVQDEDILNQVAIFLHGKFQNERQRKERQIQDGLKEVKS